MCYFETYAEAFPIKLKRDICQKFSILFPLNHMHNFQPSVLVLNGQRKNINSETSCMFIVYGFVAVPVSYHDH